MFKLVMVTMYDVIYTVDKGIDYMTAKHIMDWMFDTVSKKYFDNLLIEKVQILNAAEEVCEEVLV